MKGMHHAGILIYSQIFYSAEYYSLQSFFVDFEEKAAYVTYLY